MVQKILALFDGHVLRPEDPLSIRPNTRCLVTVEIDDTPNERPPATDYPLSEIRAIATDMGVTDLADRHDFYAHGSVQDQASAQ
jgi:hypothetical protein